MNKFIFASVLAFFFIGCGSDNSASAVDFDQPSQGKDEKQSKESTKNFTTEDVSAIEFPFSLSTNFEMDDGNIHIFNDDGTDSKYVSNWVLSYEYKLYVACGFTASVKVGDNMNFAGVQLFKKGSYDDYRFSVYSDGQFTIRDPKKTVLKLSPDSSFVDTDKFNRIKVETVDSGDVLVYVNGHLVKTIKKEDLAFELTNTDKIAVQYNVKSTASKKNPAEAWIKFESMEKVKQ